MFINHKRCPDCGYKLKKNDWRCRDCDNQNLTNWPLTMTVWLGFIAGNELGYELLICAKFVPKK